MGEVHCGRGAGGLDDKKLLLVSVPHEKLLLVSVPHEKLLLVSVSACVRIIFLFGAGRAGGGAGTTALHVRGAAGGRGGLLGTNTPALEPRRNPDKSALPPGSRCERRGCELRLVQQLG